MLCTEGGWREPVVQCQVFGALASSWIVALVPHPRRLPKVIGRMLFLRIIMPPTARCFNVSGKDPSGKDCKHPRLALP